ncbi:MAG: hypothetical protein D6806_01310 [Deltaproteobacteria bacterium]|nr:MAG: hypothetical protein D6806_01310 [Deltaproteobacteria bacterium]
MYIPIRYKSAYLFYKYRHYKEMARRFGEIIQRYPRNTYALKAVRLSLNTMYIKATNPELPEKVRVEHWKEINHWAKTFKANKILMNSKAAKKEKFADEIQSLIEESGYNVILALRKSNPLEAAQKFEKFVDSYPGSKFAHRALYAAMVIYDEARQLDNAIRAGKRLLKKYPASDRFNQTILALADLHNRVADFRASAEYNEMFFSRYMKQKKGNGKSSRRRRARKGRKRRRAKTKSSVEQLITDKQAMDALYNAALLRESMGQYKKAIKNCVAFFNTFPDAVDTPNMFYKVGLIYETIGDLRKADRIWEAYPKKYADRSTPGRLLDVLYRHAMALRKLGKVKESDGLLDEIIDSYNKLPEKVRTPEARHAAAHARFLQLEKEFNEYVSIKLVLPPRTLKRNLFKKIDMRPQLEKKYQEVIAYKDPEFAIAALVRMGQLSRNLSQSMYDAPIPAGLTPEQQDIYVQELQNQALPLEEKAMALFQKAIDVSAAKGVYCKWTLEAQEQLKNYRPKAYPPPYEAEMVATEYIYEEGFDDRAVEVPPPPPPSQPAAAPAGAAGGA